MSATIVASIRVDKLPKERFVVKEDGAVYYEFTMTVKDETKFGNNVWITEGQSREEREAKKPKVTLGNAKVVWTDGVIKTAERDEAKAPANAKQEVEADFPF